MPNLHLGWNLEGRGNDVEVDLSNLFAYFKCLYLSFGSIIYIYIYIYIYNCILYVYNILEIVLLSLKYSEVCVFFLKNFLVLTR